MSEERPILINDPYISSATPSRLDYTGALPSSSTLPSKIEQAIINATEPLPLPEGEVTDINGLRGVLLNKDEIAHWNGPVPIGNYKIFDDPNPEVIRKPNSQTVEYNQDISVRYLRPPTPVGDILIKRRDTHVPVLAPPHIIRMPGVRPSTPPAVIFREAPPEHRIESRSFIVPGKTITDLPDRKLIVEKLPSLPQKPPQIIIEKWLPPSKIKRRVVLQHCIAPSTCYCPRNLIIQWEGPTPIIKKGIKYLGVVNMNPAEYIAKYGGTLRLPSEMPKFVLDYDKISRLGDVPIKYTRDLADVDLNRTVGTFIPASATAPVEYYGDVEALKLLDPATLEREGLNQYTRSDVPLTYGRDSVHMQPSTRQDVPLSYERDNLYIQPRSRSITSPFDSISKF